MSKRTKPATKDQEREAQQDPSQQADQSEQDDVQVQAQDTVASESANETDGPEPDVEALQKQLEEAQQQAKDNWELALRAQAETENVRKRAVRDVENAHKFSLEKLVKEFLPVKDSLELGLQASEKDSADVANLTEGMELTLKIFTTAMEKCGVNMIDPTGEKFNPELHEAMTMVDSPEAESGIVIDVMQKGYQLNDRLIRPAQVIVAK